MPHDKFGKIVNIGDEIIIRFKVESITSSEEFCNVSLKSLETMPPYQDSHLKISAVNTQQCEKVNGE